MKKREFLKRGLYAVGGLGIYANSTFSSWANTSQNLSGDKPVYLSSTKNKREKVLAVLDQSKPNEYVPAAFFLHFDEKLGQGAIDRHLAFFRATNMDFVKIQYEIVLPRLDNIKSPKDWAKIPVYDKDFFEPQLAVIEALAKELKNEALILPTVYSPLSLAGQAVGENAVSHIKEDPDAVEKGFSNLTDSILNFLHESIKRGADGFYISSQGGDSKRFGDGPIFDKLIAPYDKIISQEASDKALLNILHICDYGDTSYAHLDKFVSYPGSIINPPIHKTDGTAIKPKDVQAEFKRPVFGGLDRLGVIATGTPEQAKAEVDKVLKDASPNFILGADCTVPSETPWQNLRAIIDYAHDWRVNNA
jgi:uroporphyrinogen decarboxylase